MSTDERAATDARLDVQSNRGNDSKQRRGRGDRGGAVVPLAVDRERADAPLHSLRRGPTGRSTLETFNDELAVLERPLEGDVEYIDEPKPSRWRRGFFAVVVMVGVGGALLSRAIVRGPRLRRKLREATPAPVVAAAPSPVFAAQAPAGAAAPQTRRAAGGDAPAADEAAADAAERRFRAACAGVEGGLGEGAEQGGAREARARDSGKSTTRRTTKTKRTVVAKTRLATSLARLAPPTAAATGRPCRRRDSRNNTCSRSVDARRSGPGPLRPVSGCHTTRRPDDAVPVALLAAVALIGCGGSSDRGGSGTGGGIGGHGRQRRGGGGGGGTGGSAGTGGGSAGRGGSSAGSGGGWQRGHRRGRQRTGGRRRRGERRRRRGGRGTAAAAAPAAGGTRRQRRRGRRRRRPRRGRAGAAPAGAAAAAAAGRRARRRTAGAGGGAAGRAAARVGAAGEPPAAAPGGGGRGGTGGVAGTGGSAAGAGGTGSGSYDQTILADGPVAYWAMNKLTGTEPDLTGNNHTGTYHSGTTASATMPNGDKVADFNGSSQYVSVPSSNAFSIPTTGNLTWEAWIRPDVLQFPNDSNGYVDWMGKCQDYGPTCEWEARMYSTDQQREPLQSDVRVRVQPERRARLGGRLAAGLRPGPGGQLVSHRRRVHDADAAVGLPERLKLSRHDRHLGERREVEPLESRPDRLHEPVRRPAGRQQQPAQHRHDVDGRLVPGRDRQGRHLRQAADGGAGHRPLPRDDRHVPDGNCGNTCSF